MINTKILSNIDQNKLITENEIILLNELNCNLKLILLNYFLNICFIHIIQSKLNN